MAARTGLELRLVGAGGEPVDFWRTIRSHGVAELPPNRIDAEARAGETVLAIPGLGARVVRVASPAPGVAEASVAAPLAASARAWVVGVLRRMLDLDADLSDFYAAIGDDPGLAWATGGAGRMLRGAGVFEDVVKTICTTNCAWSATERMVGALVAGLGEPAPAAHAGDAPRHAFPTPAAMAAAPEVFYRDEVRAGYRGRYLRALADGVASGELDLEPLARPEPDGPPDDEVRRMLMALPGVGPYAAAHIMLLLGRCRPLVFDSWTRPTFARLHGQPASDAAIEAMFARYGRHAGRAFWLVLTQRWFAEEEATAAPD